MTANSPEPGLVSGWQVMVGDCVETMKRLPAESIDAVITDPPYAISNLGNGDETWNAKAIRDQATRQGRGRLTLGEGFQVWCEEWAKQCLRVMRPGAHLLAFASSRTFHRLVTGIEDAGFEIRDVLMWLYSSGMPKSRRLPGDRTTNLKPAYEPIVLARRPLDGTVQETIARHGTAALEIGQCRAHGRHPANVLFSHDPRCRGGRCASDCAVRTVNKGGHTKRPGSRLAVERVFYCSKAARKERDAGCENLPSRRLDLFPRARRRPGQTRPVRNPHPTVKPIELMRWLVKLGCPEGGVVLDPFCGSGTTGIAATLENHPFTGIEKDEKFAEIAQARIANWTGTARATEPKRAK